MRISFLVLLVAACAGSGKPPISDCASYARATRAPLARMARATDRFTDAVSRGPSEGASAGRQLVTDLDAERAGLSKLRIGDAELARAHRGMLSALGEMTRALGFLAEVLERRDEARRGEARSRLRDASTGWSAGVDDLRRVCPEI